MKTCPMCAEPIQDDAVVCRHCHSPVAGDEWRAFFARWQALDEATRQSEWAAMDAAKQAQFTAAWHALGYDRMAAGQGIGDDAGMRLLIPVGTSGWAIAAGYLGLLSVLLVPAPLAVIFGIIAIRAIRKNPRTHGMGRAIFGIVMGALGTAGLVAMLLTRILVHSHVARF